MVGKGIARFFIVQRDAIARFLVRLGVTPNMLTFAGMVVTAAAGACYALGAGHGYAWRLGAGGPSAWLLLAGAMMYLASACDMLDGAVARTGGKATRFGAFLDSTLDRYSDFMVFAGIAVYYARQGTPNATFVLLAMIAFFNAFMISYSRARAEDIIDKCTVGYWQRGERSAAILIGTLAYNIPAMVLQQAALPLLTVLRRISYTHAVLSGRTPQTDVRQGSWWQRLRLWRWPRMSVPYDLVTGLNIAWLIFAPVQPFDLFKGDFQIFR
ncbi:MAG: CDP-alcohol phosphatidyltransferase family protein [Planctomycetaceae bacterium]|nr:CDP-alcohol phosphatidyltransferase family protein [Planctomycetaceae bacterium]